MFLLLLMGFGLVVHLSEFRSLRSETTRLAMESEQLRMERNLLHSKVDQLSTEKLKLRDQSKMLGSMAADFQAKAHLLRVERDELLNEVDRLRTKAAELLPAPYLLNFGLSHASLFR
jgi:chromosome segregation ATPase